MGDDLGPWTPVALERLPEVLAGSGSPWWLAGGWAIDAHLGQQSRTHDDVDVLVLRRDLVRLRASLSEWDVHAADPPGSLRPWLLGEALPDSVHDVWVRPSPTEHWAFQLMIDDTEGEDWIFRRDRRLRRPLESLSGPSSDERRQVLAPEIQLLYKSNALRAKDQQDFRSVLPVLAPAAKAWLRLALELTSPGHRWLRALQHGEPL